MAKILDVTDGRISILQADGSLLTVPVSDLTFNLSVGQEVDISMENGKVKVGMTSRQSREIGEQSTKVYHKWWFWAILIIIGHIISYHTISNILDLPAKMMQTTSYSTGKTQQTQKSTGEAQQTQKEKKADVPSVPAEYESALKTAESYNKSMNFSKMGLYDQLTSQFEKFTAEAAQYAIDNLKADYNQNALKNAKSYVKNSNMSPAAVRDLLISKWEKFTESEADYAVAHLND